MMTSKLETLPLINFYEQKKLLKTINGDQEKELVSASIERILTI